MNQIVYYTYFPFLQRICEPSDSLFIAIMARVQGRIFL